MLNVKIKNFQSIGDISFDVTGFTVIVGKNNLGKSAIIRAIDAALNNRTGSEFIRWGKLKSEVTLKKDDLEINWSKGETATYKVNGKAFSKLNRSIPQPIIDAGIRRIEIGDQKFNPLIAHQFEELFLLDKPGSVITDVLSIIYNLNVLSDADGLCLKEMKSEKSLLKTRESDLTSLQDHIEKYKDIESTKEELEKIKILDKKCEFLKAEIVSIETCATKLKTISNNISILKTASDIKIPSTLKVETGILEYQWLNQASINLKELLVSVKNLHAALKVEIPEYSNTQARIIEVKEISQTADIFNSLVTLVNRLRSTLDVLDTLKNFSISSIEEQINSLDHIKRTNEEFMSSVKLIREIKSELEKTSQALTVHQNEYSQYKICPLCNKPL